jgi:hypothetical protein
MPEEYTVIIYPLVHALMRESQNGTPSSALAKSVERRLTALGASVTVVPGRNRNAVIVHWVHEAKPVQGYDLVVEAHT